MPKVGSETDPDTRSIRSDSMMLFAAWVFWSGTMTSWEIPLALAKPEPIEDQDWPFQKERYEVLPSDELLILLVSRLLTQSN